MGSKSSSAASTSSEEQVINVSDAGDVSDGQKITGAAGRDVSIVTSDMGAIDAAGEIVLKTLDNLRESDSLQAQTTRDTVDKSLKLAEFSAQSEAGRITGDIFKTTMIVVAGVGIVYLATRKK